jgi:hypothetical protein
MLQRNIPLRTCEPPGAAPVQVQETTKLTFSSKIEPDRALRLGASAAAAPLWAAYMAVAGAGVTYWWMTAWTRRTAEPRSFVPRLVSSSEPAPVEAIEAEIEEIEETDVEAAMTFEAAGSVVEFPAVDAPANGAGHDAPKSVPAKAAAPKTVAAKPRPKPTTPRKS